MKKKITIFGSTGSIGEAALDIVKSHPDKYEVVGMTANKNYKKLLEQVDQFNPKVICISDEKSYNSFKRYCNSNVIEKMNRTKIR